MLRSDLQKDVTFCFRKWQGNNTEEVQVQEDEYGIIS